MLRYSDAIGPAFIGQGCSLRDSQPCNWTHRSLISNSMPTLVTGPFSTGGFYILNSATGPIGP